MSVSFKIERTPAQGKKVTGRTNRQISNHLNSDSSDNDETQKSSKKESIQFISHFDEARFVCFLEKFFFFNWINRHTKKFK